MRLVRGGLRGCYAALDRGFTLSGCFTGEVDGLWVDGSGTPTPENRSVADVTLGAGALATWRLARRRRAPFPDATGKAPAAFLLDFELRDRGQHGNDGGPGRSPLRRRGSRGARDRGLSCVTDSPRPGRFITTGTEFCYVDAQEGLSERAPAHDLTPSLTFQLVYDANVDFVWKTMCRLGVRGAAVEDAVQEVFVVVHRKLATFEGRSSMRTWLFQIARRVAHDQRRTVRRKEHPPQPHEPTPDIDAIAADDSASPDASTSKADAVRVLYELLDMLDVAKREVFILAELEQMAAPRIAEALGINVNTVYSRLRLAREAFNLALARRHVRDGKTR